MDQHCHTYPNSQHFSFKDSVLSRYHNQPFHPILHKLCSRLSAPASASGPSVCLGLQGQQENGGGCKEGGRLHESRGAWGKSMRCGEVPLWGTHTIIKDSTAASAWFACLIICHMLHITAISHIRALPLQQTSLRLHESVGGSRHHAALMQIHHSSPFEILLCFKLSPLLKTQQSPKVSVLE